MVPASNSTPGEARSGLAPSPSTLRLVPLAPFVVCGVNAIDWPFRWASVIEALIARYYIGRRGASGDDRAGDIIAVFRGRGHHGAGEIVDAGRRLPLRPIDGAVCRGVCGKPSATIIERHSLSLTEKKRQPRPVAVVGCLMGWPPPSSRVSRGIRRSDRQGIMIEAVIWDFGGVLTTSPFEAFARFEAERGLPADIIRRTNAANHWENAWAKFERAEVGLEEFDRLFAAESLALGAEVRGKDVLPLLSGDLRPEMIEALRREIGNSRPAASPTTFQPTASAARAAARSMSQR